MSARFTNRSMFTGITRTIELPQYSQDEFDRRYTAWQQRRALIQEAFPELSDDAREFIMTGVTADEWNKAFGEEQ